MATGLGDAIRALVADKGISEELVVKTVEEFLLAAYKKKFGTQENAVVRFNEDDADVTIYARKEIVDEVMDPVTEISLEEARELNDEAEIGDELLIGIDPAEFDRVAVQSAKQKARERLRDIQKDTLYSEFADKVGEMIIGYYQRERNGNIFVDLGKTEGLMPKRYQSPREVYRPNDRIKALIYEVTKSQTGLQIILSRTHTEFVKRIFELEVPEVYDKTVEIYKIVREPGYRTKIAVYSNREDVDPVGACVGLRGVRIQAIVRELEGEKIDILKFDNDPRMFIKNALSPAEVSQVVILDEPKRQALAVVPETQLSLAIGKQGLNVRLANRLADWSIDVKTEAQFAEMDIAGETKRAVSALFSDVEQEEEITTVAELPDVPAHIVTKLSENGIELIEDLVQLTDEQLNAIETLTAEDVQTIKQIVADNVEIIEEEYKEGLDEAVAESEEERYEEEQAGGEAGEEGSTTETAAAPGTADTASADATSKETAEEPEAGAEKAEQAEDEETSQEGEDDEEITDIADLPGIPEHVVSALKDGGIDDIVELISKTREELAQVPGLSEDDVNLVRSIIEESVEIIEPDDEEGAE